MSGPKTRAVVLSDRECQDLERLVAGHKTEQQLAKRARIVLLAAENKSELAITRALAVSRNMVRLWRRRWLALQAIALEDLSVAERLQDCPRPGAPARLTAEQICQIKQLACEQPQASARPISQWSGREIAEEVMQRQIVDRISPRHASRLLKKGACNPIASVSG